MLDFRLEPPPSSLLARFPWLMDANSWAMTSRGDEHPSVNDRGVWPVGNGYVFAHAGLAKPFNRLQEITGPTYQTEGNHRPGGAFGDCWIELRDGDATIEFPEQHIWRPRASGVLVTVGVGADGLALVVMDFAPPDRPVLLRSVEIWGAERLVQPMLVIRAPDCTPLPDDHRICASHRDQNLVLGVSESTHVKNTSTAAGSLVVELAGEAEVVEITAVLATGRGVGEALQAAGAVNSPAAELEATREFWSGWLSGTRTPALWPQDCEGPTGSVAVMQDLVETLKIDLRMQQSLPGGAVSPMVHFKGVWARDSNGPVRAFLAMGALDEARLILDYYYRATQLLGRLPNSAPLDLPVADAVAPVDWAETEIPPAETPSFIILQHLWWLEAGGDPGLIRDHWDYLHRCATGQRVSPEGRLTFNGDETYLHGALYSVFPDRCGWPNGFIAEDGDNGYAPWSLESGVLFVAAQEAMAKMASAVGMGEGGVYNSLAAPVREAIERDFWLDSGFYAPALYPLTETPHRVPFAPVNLKALWVGFHAGDSERARSDLAAVIDLVGLSGTTPDCGWGVGTTASYLLHALLETGSDLAPAGLRNLVSLASPAGDWAEVYSPGGKPSGGYSVETPNRLRPWEGGLALAAIYRYFETRDAADEPSSAAWPRSPKRLPRRGHLDTPASNRVLLVTCDVRDLDSCRARGIATGEITVVEIGAPIPVDYFARGLFDPSRGDRSFDELVLGAGVTRVGRRSMKTEEFWTSSEILAAFDSFERSGGRIVRL